MSKIRTCIENLCFDLVWYCVKCFTYAKEVFCCCFTSKYESICDDEQIKKSYNFDYNFLVIEIKVNNKSYTFDNYKDFMIEDGLFLTKDFVYDYIFSTNNLKTTNGEEEYIVTIMDDKTKLITLDKNTCLKLNKSKYTIINYSEL